MGKRLLVIVCCIMGSLLHAQINISYATVDSTVILNRIPTIITRGTLIKTAPTHFFEILDTVNLVPASIHPIAIVYSNGDAHFLRIEGSDRLLPCLRLREVIETNIDGDFKGWDGTTTFKLTNSQEWRPLHNIPNISIMLYHPSVIIYLTPDGYKMKIEGLDEEPIFVKKIK